MPLPAQLGAIFLGVGLTLTAASSIGWLLKRQVARGQPHGVIDNLNARINAWWLMVGVLLVAFWAGAWGVILLFAGLSAAALHEFNQACGASGSATARAWLYGLTIPAQYALIAMDWYGLYAIFIPVYAFLGLAVAMAVLSRVEDFLLRLAKLQLGLMLCVYCASHVPALMLLDIPGFEGRHLLLIVFLVLVVQASDVLQYIWGKLFGRHPLAPRLSPSKTVEGALGGVLSASALGAAVHGLTPFTPWQAAGAALTICLMGLAGGLVMSAIKRNVGAKDWGQLISGHGGVLDRIDSLIFAAPVYFHMLRYGWTPD